MTMTDEIVSIIIQDKLQLSMAYMPFIKNGGLFISTYKTYPLGKTLLINLTLMHELEKFTFLGKVVWLTPPAAQGGRVAGVGVQFPSENYLLLRDKIEIYLAEFSDSDQRTATM